MKLRWILAGALLVAGSSKQIQGHEVKVVPYKKAIIPLVNADEHVSTAVAELDFGEVGFGLSETLELFIDNVSSEPQSVRVTIDDPGASASLRAGDEAFELVPGGGASSREIEVTYSPQHISDGLDTVLLVVASDPLGYTQTVEVSLTGEAREPIQALATLMPGGSCSQGVVSSVTAIDLEADVGETDWTRIRLCNSGEAEVTGTMGGLANFISLPCWWDVCFYSGSVEADSFSLAPGEGMEIYVTFAPTREWPEGTEHIVSWNGGDPASPLAELALGVEAVDAEEEDDVVVDAHLVLDKTFHAFGMVAPGSSASVDLQLHNTGSAAVVNGPILGLSSGSHCVVLGDGQEPTDGVCFYDATLPNPQPLTQVSLGPNESLPIRVEFAPATSTLPFAATVHFTGGAEAMTFTATGAASAGVATARNGSGLTPVPVDIGLRGMINENTFLSSGSIDHINAMTGNLMLTLPIGQSYRIGPSLTHGLSLVYNSSVWDTWSTEEGPVEGQPPWGNPLLGARSAPAYGSNAGLGWRLSLGELYRSPSRQSGSSSGLSGLDEDRLRRWPNRGIGASPWLYVAPDGSRIRLGEWSSGNTLLRLRETSPTTVELDFDDGTIHVFRKVNNQDRFCDLVVEETQEKLCWRLREIQDIYGNQASFRYTGFDNAQDRATITIEYPYSRTTTIELSKALAHGKPTPGFPDVERDDMQLAVDKVILSSFGGGSAEYDFVYTDAALVRGCPSDHDAALLSDRRMTAPLLSRIVFPAENGEEAFTFAYNTDQDTAAAAATHCDPLAATMDLVTLPAGGKIQYEWGNYTQPSLCLEQGFVEEATGTAGVRARRLFDAGGDARGYTLYSQGLREWQTYNYLPNQFCNRQTLSVTDVVHGPNVGSEQDPLYKVDRYYHAMLRTADEEEMWPRGVHGLPINRHVDIDSTEFPGTKIWLSSETAECGEADFDHPSCEIQRRTYKRYEWLGGNANHNPFRDRPSFHRYREAVVLERQEYGPRHIERKHEDWDGRGHFRKVTTKSNFGGIETTFEETAFYGESRPEEVLFDAFPATSEPWLLNLYSEKRKNTTGVDRVTEYDFDPSTGALRCRRTWLGDESRSAADVAVRHSYDPNGFLTWEEVAGGDGGDLSTGAGAASMCPSAPDEMDYRTCYSYSKGERSISQPQDSSSPATMSCEAATGPLGPRILYRKIDANTGLPSAACDHTTSPPTCEKYLYDERGRQTEVDRGWKLGANDALVLKPTGERLADTAFSYDTTNSGGTVFRAKLKRGSIVLDQIKIVYDGLGFETEDWWESHAGWVRNRIFYHQRGFKRAERTPRFDGPDDGCRGACRTIYKHDIYGRVREVKSPLLNDESAAVSPGARDLTSYRRGHGAIHFEIEEKDFLTDGTQVQSDLDHLGRVWQVTERGQLDVASPARNLRQRFVKRTGNETSTRLSPLITGGAPQKRKTWHDGRGFLYRESHPEWAGATATYTYDALGNVTSETRPDSSTLTYQLDALGRVETVKVGPAVLKEFDYYAGTGRLWKARRKNYLTCDQTFGYLCDTEAVVEETFTYDSNGQLETKRSVLTFGSSVHYDVSQAWRYNDQGLVETVGYPICAPASWKCDNHNNGAPPSRSATYAYSKGDLLWLKLDGSDLAFHSYHANGVPRRIDYYEGAQRQWHDEISTGDYGVAHIKKIGFYDQDDPAGAPTWSSGEHLYNGRGNLVRLEGGHSNIALTYDALDRLTSYNKSGEVHYYMYDDFDNITQLGAAPIVVDPESNRMIQVNAASDIEYDPLGHLTRFLDQWYSYDALGMALAHTRDPGSAPPNPNDQNRFRYQAIYVYNAADQRVAFVDRIPDPNDFNADQNLLAFLARDLNGKVLREFREAGFDVYSYRDYVWAGRQLRAFEDGDGQLYHVHLDHLGSSRFLTKGLAFAGQQEFDPWGNHLASDELPMRIGFTGHEADRNDLFEPAADGRGLTMNFGARSYAPLIARFLSPDPARDASSWSLYGYAANSPLKMVDPTGLTGEDAANAFSYAAGAATVTELGVRALAAENATIHASNIALRDATIKTTARGVAGNIVARQTLGGVSRAALLQSAASAFGAVGKTQVAVATTGKVGATLAVASFALTSVAVGGVVVFVGQDVINRWKRSSDAAIAAAVNDPAAAKQAELVKELKAKARMSDSFKELTEESQPDR